MVYHEQERIQFIAGLLPDQFPLQIADHFLAQFDTLGLPKR